MDNTGLQRAKGTGLLITGLTETVKRYKPDILLVVGDREESIATAVIGNYMNTLVAHIGGGDSVYGNSDDPVRFSVSKLAHLHFVTSSDSAKNLKRVQEEAFRIFNVGNPALDNIRLTPVIPIEKIGLRIDVNIQPRRYVVLIHHPLSSESSEALGQMQIVLQGIERFCLNYGYLCLGIYPNTDPGAMDIIRVIDSYKSKPLFNFFKTLPWDFFVNIMRGASALIGNSSMGILEAPFYKLPVVNIGNRQKGRFQAGNVEFVGYTPAGIYRCMEKACLNREYRRKIRSLRNPFGNGYSAEKIRRRLASINLADKRWYIKRGVA
jgi:GDP/UDP-N,N'-diacetylbacillosamine 2-epimerase (hydrolysing)